MNRHGHVQSVIEPDGSGYHECQPDPGAWWMARVGKKAAGRLLDGRE